jgi:hypothetical protein
LIPEKALRPIGLIPIIIERISERSTGGHMFRFVIDRFKGRPALGIAEAKFANGSLTVTGHDNKSVREIEFLLNKPLSTPRFATSGANALSVSMVDLLEPGSEEHFIASIKSLPDYGFSARKPD